MLLLLLSLIDIIYCSEYNYPLLIGQPNTIFLSQYTPKDIEVPYYQFQSSNAYNLEIQQSILPLFNQINNSSETILFATNYVEESGIYSNQFWFLSNQQILYAGIINSSGNLIIEKINIQLDQLVECQYINLITYTYGMLTCLNQQSQVIFIMVNSTTLQQTQYNSNYSIPLLYFNLKTNLYASDIDDFVIFISYFIDMNANIAHFIMSSNSLEYMNSQQFSGSYNQMEIIQDNLFLLNSQSIQYLNLKDTQRTGTISINNSGNYLIYMAVYQISDQIFRIALLNNLQVQCYYFDSQLLISIRKSQNQFIINPYQSLIQISVTINSIYIITNNYIMKLEGEFDINPQSYIQIEQCNYVLIQFERQIILTQQVLNGQVILSTLLFNNPQILISINQTLMIEQDTNNYFLQLLVTPQTLQQVKTQIKIWLILKNLTLNDSLCPISFQRNYTDIYINFPDQYNVPFTEVFLGPNLTQSINSSSPQILYVDTTSNYIKYQIKSIQIIFLQLCSIYESSAIYCSQYKNNTVEISFWNPILQNQNIQFISNQLMKSCSCIMQQDYIYILMEFNNSILVQQFDYQSQPKNQYEFSMPIQILSSTILKQTLFIITIDGNLTAYSLINYQDNEISFTITNYTFNYLYTNQQNYPNFLFIDNQINLVILSYKGLSSFEILNTIQYPIVEYNQITIGILKTGIYMAIISQTNNFLYFYPIQSVYYSNSIQNYYQVDLLGYQFQNGQIISSYTSLHFFLILQNQIGIFCAYFSGSDSPFSSFIYANMIFSNSQNIHINQISVIQKQKFYIELVQLFTNTSLAINGTVLFGYFQMVPYYVEANHSYSIAVQYQATNQDCTLDFYSQVHIVLERSYIKKKQFNSEAQVLKIQNKTTLMLDPSSLFYGNIQNYSISCRECKSLNFTQPINYLNQKILNFNFQAVIKNNNQIFIQNNISLYQLNLQNGVQNKLYNFPYAFTYCFTLFVDKFTNFPVSICNNLFTYTYIYAYNITENTLIQYNFSQCYNYYKGSYNNGVLQVLTINSKLHIQTYSYYSFYFWIQNNTIYLDQIYNSNNLCTNSYLQFVYLSMSSNYTNDPCQIFGFTSLSRSGIDNPIFYLLYTCISSQISLQFGYLQEKYSENFIIYFQIITWNLYQTLPIYFQFNTDIQQYQSSIIKTKDVIESQFIVSLVYSIDIYTILFNIREGTIIGFHKQTSLFLSYNKNISGYYIFQGLNGLLINFNYVNYTTISANIYSFIQNYKTQQQPVQIIGQDFHTFYTIGAQLFGSVTDNYVFVTTNLQNYTIFYPIQNYLEIDIDITDIQQSQIDIIASNQQSQSQQSYFLLNEAYQQTPKQKNEFKIGLIVGLSLFILIVIIIIIALIIRYFKYKQTTTRNSNYLELERKQ